MKRVMLFGTVGLVLVVLVVLGVGAMLPVSHVASVRAPFTAPPADVYATISNYAAYPEWRPSVERIEELPAANGGPRWQEVGSTGPLPMELVDSDPPNRLVTRILSEGMPFGGTWTFEVTASDSGSELTITENGEVYSPLFRFVSRFIMGHHRTATTFLNDLGQKYGEDVTVEVVE